MPPAAAGWRREGDLAQAREQAVAFETDARLSQGLQAFLVADAAALSEYVALKSGTGDRAKAVAAARALVTVVRDNNTLTADGYLPRRERMALDLALRIAVDVQDADLGLQAMAVLAGSRIAQANRLVVDRLVSGDPALAARVKAFQDQVLAGQRADTAYLLALTDKAADVAAARSARTAAATTLDALRAGLARDYPRWTERRGTRLANLADLQHGLAAKEGVLAIVPAFDGLYLLAASAGRAVVLRSGESRARLEDRLQRFRTAIAANAFDPVGAAELHQLLLPAAVRAALTGVERLRVVPVGAFASLPFAALLERPVARVDARSPWLVRRYALSVAADFAAPIAPRTGSRGNRPLLAVGAPAGLGGATGGTRVRSVSAYFRGGAVDAASLAALPSLPGADREIDRIVARFGPALSTRLTGGDATEARLRSLDLKRYGTLLFATHGLVAGELEGVAEPALVMTSDPGSGGDGLLTATEIERLSLDADWVILSACDTAAGENATAPAYSGLARAFRYAGARSLLVSHGPVRDDIAADLTSGMIGNDAAQVRSDVALQRAMLRAMRIAEPDPYLWAPFILALGG